MRLDDARAEDPYRRVGRQQVEVMNAVTEAVAVAKDLGRGCDAEMVRVTALVAVAHRLHAKLGDGLDRRLGILEPRFVLDLEDHRPSFSRKRIVLLSAAPDFRTS